MSQGSSVASGLVRVTIASGSRRVDLVLPGSIPVAELVPELARSVGLLDASTVYGGYRLVTQEGRLLVNNAGLTMQGIEDGGLLTVTAGVDDKAPRVYDDVVEAMADVVENELKPWEPAAGRRTALGAGSILLGLGALALLLQGESLLGGVAAAVIAALLVVGGIVLARAQGEPEAGVASRCSPPSTPRSPGSCSRPATCPPGSWPLDDAFFTDPLLFAGLGVLAVGLVAVVGPPGRPRAGHPGHRRRRGARRQLGADPGRLARAGPPSSPSCMTLVVLAGSIFPWLALGVTGTSVDQLYSLHDITADPEEIDPDEVADDARVGHEILLAVSATVGTLLVLLRPVRRRPRRLRHVLAAVCCLAVMFRTRQYRTGAEVLAGLASGILGLVSVAMSMLLIHDGWRAGAAIGLAGVGRGAARAHPRAGLRRRCAAAGWATSSRR